MATAADVKNTLDLMKNLWPDVQFSKEDFTKPESVVRFYSSFIAEINDKVSFMINEEYSIDEFDDIQEFDKRVSLYCKVAKILKKMQPISISMSDFYFSSKKMYPVIKFSTHFIVYLNIILDEVSGMINENINKQMESENFKTLKQKFLEDSAENAENIARCIDSYEKLKATFEKVKNLHEKMKEDKVLESKICSEKETEKNDIQNEVDNLEYELKLLEDKENDLKECIITERDFENLRKTEKYLEIEHQQCNNVVFEDFIGRDIESVKRVEEHAKSLSVLSLDSLDIGILQDLKKRAKADRDVQKKLNDELTVLNNTVITETKKLKEYEQALAKTKSFCLELQEKMSAEEQNELKCYHNRVATCSLNFEECQRLESEIISKHEDIKKIKEDEHKLNTVVAQEYKKILNKDKRVTETFHNMLKNLKNLY